MIEQQGYCVKCKKKQDVKEAQLLTMKNGKPALKGACAVCSTKVSVFLKAEK